LRTIFASLIEHATEKLSEIKEGETGHSLHKAVRKKSPQEGGRDSGKVPSFFSKNG